VLEVTAIRAAAEVLRDCGRLETFEHGRLVQAITEESGRLIRAVENVSEFAEAGAFAAVTMCGQEAVARPERRPEQIVSADRTGSMDFGWVL
jgi:hypothetical protein